MLCLSNNKLIVRLICFLHNNSADLLDSAEYTYICDDSKFLDVGGLRVQQLPNGLLLVELPPCQSLHKHNQGRKQNPQI